MGVLRIINEPTAAALGYGLDQAEAGNGKREKFVLVFDLGGGTFDVSVLRIDGGIVEVKATGGDTHLGGEDFDMALVDWMLAELKKKKLAADEKVKAKCKRAAEIAKRSLSSSDNAEIEIGELVSGEDGVLKVTRTEFEKMTASFWVRTLDTVKAVLKDAKVETKDTTIRRMVEEAEAAKSHDADYAKKLEVKNALEEASYDLPEDECEELVQWLAECSLEATSLSVLERKLSQIKAKL